MRKIVFLLCIATLCCTCVRRTRNYPDSNVRNKRIYSSTTKKESQRSSRNNSRQDKSQSRTDLKKLSASQVFEKYNSAVFMIFTSDGWNDYQGSGFFVSSNGIGISNYHVFQGTTIGYEQIKLSNGNTYKIKKVIAKDEDDDYIVFQVDALGGNFNFIPVGNRTPKVGEQIYTIGSPYGLENTFSSGEISQLRGDNLIQINAPIDHGSSGGALINEYGEVIGITTAGLDKSGANLNFAVDINVVKPYLK